MRRIICILMCLSMASMVSALNDPIVTNGDFQSQTDPGTDYDIDDWYDYGGPAPDPPAEDYGPFFIGYTAYTWNLSKLAGMGHQANSTETGGNHSYAYQSIGTYETTDPPAIEVILDWGMAPEVPPPNAYGEDGTVGIGVQILEWTDPGSDAWEPNEWDGAAHDIYEFIKTEEDPDNPVTLIGQGSKMRYFDAGTGVTDERFQINLATATVGKELFLRFNNIRGNVTPYSQVDNIEIIPAYVLNQLPEDGAVYVAPERTSAENDLVFNIVDSSVITSIDVLFGPENDPNLSSKPEYKIVTGMSIPEPNIYTITLETELASDLDFSTEYFWKVIGYTGATPVYESLVTSFTTIQYGPLLTGVTPTVQGVWADDDAVFSLEYYNKTESLQWWKEGDVDPLENGSKYAGVDSNSLTIKNCSAADEGLYYCVGTYTEAGPTVVTAESPRGELAIKELKAYYPFTSTYEDSGKTYTPDIRPQAGYSDMELVGGASLASTDPIGDNGSYLVLNNPRDLEDPDEPAHTQYGDIADDSVANHREITVSCWVKPSLLNLDYERYARVFDFGQDNDNYFYLTMLQNSNRALSVISFYDADDDEVNDSDIIGNGPIGYGTQWLYVVLTIGEYPSEDEDAEEGDMDTIGKFYINGVYTVQPLDPATLREAYGMYHPSDVPKTLNYIGKAIAVPLGSDGEPTGGHYPNFNGLIDELKIYNYAKTAEEIAQEYMDVMTAVDSICNLDAYDMEDYDYDDSCAVDLPDVAVFAEKWLVDYYLYTD